MSSATVTHNGVCSRCGVEHDRHLRAQVYAASGDVEGWLCADCSDYVAAIIRGEDRD